MLWLWALIYAIVIFQLSSLATTIYLHRAATHRALDLHPAIELAMRIELWLFTGIVTREWVAVHRKHHHHTDVLGDPHSPVLEGLWAILLANAWYYKRETRNPETLQRYARDIPQRWFDRWMLDRGGWGIALGAALTCGLMSLLGARPLAALAWGLSAYLLQGLLYIFANALINGACHAIGYRNFQNPATNLRWVAWLSAGEGLHNNHHQFPSSGKLSLHRSEVDPAWPVIRLLRRLSLARVRPLPRALAAPADPPAA